MVDDVWKKFQIPHERKDSILERAAAAFQMRRGQYTFEEFWALRSVSFRVNAGESVGIIGENGSGKSTLLKIFAKVIRPSRGKVITKGKIVPILELGIGFHPDLSAIDNVKLYGSIMGIPAQEMAKRVDQILEYSDLVRFRDAKLKNFSSGMQIRLAFSVAIETDPDIFLIDEALAVGDMDFYNKCIKKFREFQRIGKTLVIVSHSTELIKDFCSKTAYLSKGELVKFGPTDQVVDAYVNGNRP